MNIEFLGLPGVGKTTLRNALLKDLWRLDKQRYMSDDEAFLRVSKSSIDRIFRLPLNCLPHPAALWLSGKTKNRSLMEFDARNLFLAGSGKALEAFFSSKVYQAMSIPDRKIVIGSFLEMGSQWQSIQGGLPADSVVFFEEGFIQKSFMFVDKSSDLAIEEPNIGVYLENIPLPDMVIYLTADFEICLQRMLSRSDGLIERLHSATNEDVRRFLVSAENHLSFVSRWLRDNNQDTLIELNSEEDINRTREVVAEAIRSAE